ncbi:hypothetical protein ACOME3_009460 [Neoechinorhynchus agilis]
MAHVFFLVHLFVEGSPVIVLCFRFVMNGRGNLKEGLKSEVMDGSAVEGGSEASLIEDECPICLEKVKNTPTGRYGIQDGCEHRVCLQCLRTWRTDCRFLNHRQCPCCRKRCDLVIPTKVWYKTKEEREKMINDYRARAVRRYCKYYLNQQNCPFDKMCPFSHKEIETSIDEPDDPLDEQDFFNTDSSEISVSEVDFLSFQYELDEEDDDDLDTLGDDFFERELTIETEVMFLSLLISLLMDESQNIDYMIDDFAYRGFVENDDNDELEMLDIFEDTNEEHNYDPVWEDQFWTEDDFNENSFDGDYD